MLLKRKAYDKLAYWKSHSNGKTAILIDGARRVGKSFLAEEFGRNEYKSFFTVNFAQITANVKRIFENDSMDLDLFFNELSAVYATKLYPRESLIIFDEVQRYPKAREMIKFLVADGRYDFIETGSLISIKQNIQDIVIPSEEEHFTLNPLDFEEFLWAMGDETSIPYAKMCFDTLKPLGPAVHRKLLNSFRQYMLIGGMPQVVSTYIETKDFEEADLVKRTILRLYRQDITKFAAGYESKVQSIFDEIPGQLSKKEKKFNLSSLGKSSKMRTYEDSFMWLNDGMIINTCYNATDPTVGLSMYLDSTSMKCYMADTGLLIAHAFGENAYTDNELYRAVLLDKIGINEGMLMENIVAQTFVSSGRKLFFYSRSDTNNRENHMEIDFLLSKGKKICPVEVKSSSYSAHSSLDKFTKKFKGRIGQPYILYGKDVLVKDDIVHLPIYMAMFL